MAALQGKDDLRTAHVRTDRGQLKLRLLYKGLAYGYASHGVLGMLTELELTRRSGWMLPR